MKNMTLNQIAAACNGQLIAADAFTDKEIAGVVLDSRQVEKDFLFIATVGERVDGHNFIPDVFEKGALAVVCERAPEQAPGPYILVENSLLALKKIAKWYRSQLNIPVIGITGSVGKTSTKEFISSVLAVKYQVLKTEGNYNNEIGMPLTLLKIREHHQVAVLEMGISDFGEMHRLSEIAKPDICVLTNIGQCHLENLKSREGILKAKTEIFDFMSEDGFVCINGDDDMLATIREVKGHKPITFGMGPENQVKARAIKTKGLFGSTCVIERRLDLPGTLPATTDCFTAEVPLPGEHMILNALAATAVGTILGLTKEEIAQGISLVKPVGGRSNILRHPKYTIIDDCYNANPVSMKAALDLLMQADSNKVAILGDMFELGTTEKELHREIGIYAASIGVNTMLCVGTLSQAMYEGAIETLDNNHKDDKTSTAQSVLYYETRDKLIDALPSVLKDGDTILVKASHGMGFDQVVKALQETI